MGALAPISPWIPDDDLLLKNSVEAGASLEALAKGAVQFSRRFTIQELQNRWHALLYDPDTAAPASALMVELSSQSNKLGESKGNGTPPGKRKDESVRSHYYAMRKRIGSEPFSNVDLSFLATPTFHSCQEQVTTIHNEHPVGSCMIRGPVVDHFDHHCFPQVARADTAAGSDEAAAHAYHNEHRNSLKGAAMVRPVANTKLASSSGYSVVHPDPQFDERISDDISKNSREHSESEFFELSNSLMDFTNEEERLLMDIDGKDMMERSCLDDLSSILLSSPHDIHHDDIPCIAEPNTSVAMHPCLMFPDVACSGDYGVTGDKLLSGYKTCDSNTSVPSSTLAPNPHPPECRNGVICCILNTEDPDIPCNDEVYSPTQVQPSFAASLLQYNAEEAGDSLPPSTANISIRRMASEQDLVHAKEEEFLATSQATEPQLLPEMSVNNPITYCRASELPKSVSLDMAFRHMGIVRGEPSEHGLANIASYSISAGELKEDTTKVELGSHCKFDFLLDDSIHCSDVNENHHQKIINGYKQEQDVPGALQNHASAEHGSFEMPFSEPTPNPSILDQEVLPAEDNNDIPHFSDIEALILDMDLGLCDQDFCSMEVSRYQHEEAKRAILRLEQGAQSYRQRAMASHRAFAILYGRRSKHYIRKPEVSIGRATDDIRVDIDLAKEGRANKISRRQAIIKMEEDGSFSLKNLGKGSIVVNGKDVASGHCIKLGSGCLIEIRSMNFIFETNQKVVKQYLANAAKKNQDKGLKFEWSPEGVF